MKFIIEIALALLAIVILLKLCIRYEAAHPLSDEEQSERQTFQP